MPVFETFAARKRAAELAGSTDVYVYDALPVFLRKQIGMVLVACIGRYQEGYAGSVGNPDAWDLIVRIAEKELETFGHQVGREDPLERCTSMVTVGTDVDEVLSLIEICCRVLERSVAHIPRHAWEPHGITQEAKDGLEEINARFRQHSVGYEYSDGQLIRIDSEFIHNQVVKEALCLMRGDVFTEAEKEFRTAHQHYRTDNYRDCNTAALRSMESVLKTICSKRNWPVDAGATVERLLNTVRQNGLFPDYLGPSFDQLIGAIKGGLPKVRDKQGGHAGSPNELPVPDYIARYALHLAASNIVLLVQAYEALPKLSQ